MIFLISLNKLSLSFQALWNFIKLHLLSITLLQEYIYLRILVRKHQKYIFGQKP